MNLRTQAEYADKHKKWKQKHDYAELVYSGDEETYTKLVNDMGADFFEGLINFNVDVHHNVFTDSETGNKLLAFRFNMTIDWNKLPIEYNMSLKDLACRLALRTARNLFAQFPVDIVLFNYYHKEIILKTGHLKEVYYLSVLFTREVFLSLNFDLLDPVEAMSNFKYRMNAGGKYGSLLAVNPIVLEEEAERLINC